MPKHRHIKYGLWMSELEASTLEELCRKAGLSKASFLRRMIMGNPIKERPSADFLTLSDSIDHFGNNFNQLVKKVNTTDAVSRDDLKQAISLMKRIYGLMRDWEKVWR